MRAKPKLFPPCFLSLLVINVAVVNQLISIIIPRTEFLALKQEANLSPCEINGYLLQYRPQLYQPPGKCLACEVTANTFKNTDY